jgi:hypothetical protein
VAISLKRTGLISRRECLGALVGLALFAVLFGETGYRYTLQLLRRYSRLRVDGSSEGGRLSAKEFEIVKSLFEVISPAPAPSAETLLEFVSVRTLKVNGYFREYKNGCFLLDRRATKRFGAGFVALSQERRGEILKEILPVRLSSDREKKITGVRHEIRSLLETLFASPETRFREFVFMDLLKFYWSSSAGWAAVGYASHPGVPSAPRAYTLAPLHKG